MGIKASLRAWLIDLVREAIRKEQSAAKFTEQYGDDPLSVYRMGIAIEAAKPSAVLTNFNIEPSFEQMQSDALQEQEKFYEVKK